MKLDQFLVLSEKKRVDIEVVGGESYRLDIVDSGKKSIELVKPWLDGCVEAGYLVIPKRLSVHVGDAQIPRLLWVRLFSEWASKIRLGYPLLVFDFIHGEYIAGIIKMMGYDVAWHELVDRDASEVRGVLTSELIKSGDTEFLELVPLVGIDPICSLKNMGDGTVVRGDVNFAPHIRAPAYIPSEGIMNVIYGLPDDGIVYGAIMFGDEIIIDPKTCKCIPYRMRYESLFEHELVTGTTGKGKTAKCKNDIYHFVKNIGGAVIVIDTHNEYSVISEDPIKEDDPVKPNDLDYKIWSDLDVFPSKIDDVVVWKPVSCGIRDEAWEDSRDRLFTIRFNGIKAGYLQYYLPALSPQGYYVLPKLVRRFRSVYRGENDTLEKFYRWLENANFSKDFISEATREALLRRIAAVLEEGIFDVEGFEDIDIKQMLSPRRVNIIRLDTAKSMIARRIVVMHIIGRIAREKLTDYGERYPPTMLLIDEAHNYFPRFVYDTNEREWVMRTVSWVERIAREGRKFKLRIQFSTQSPEDLNPRILKTVNTYTLFGLTPLQVKTIKKFMELPVNKTTLMNLPTRCAVVYSRTNTSIPMKIRIPWTLLRHKITKKT